ncbi:MAG: 50S ribosomal protein L31 [Defluviitaleaceae bacterium]|nr:50S ribosomal protein L31 [Defluviitaleaceae bacterium]
MNKDIQPKYFDANVKCACGVEFAVGSTIENIRVELCSKCHPFYTGSQRLVTSAGGQVDKFKKRYNMEAGN